MTHTSFPTVNREIASTFQEGLPFGGYFREEVQSKYVTVTHFHRFVLLQDESHLSDVKTCNGFENFQVYWKEMRLKLVVKQNNVFRCLVSKKKKYLGMMHSISIIDCNGVSS